jgi:hypothetical protein
VKIEKGQYLLPCGVSSFCHGKDATLTHKEKIVYEEPYRFVWGRKKIGENKMNKLAAMLLLAMTLCMGMFVFTACGDDDDDSPDASDSDTTADSGVEDGGEDGGNAD